MARFVDGLSSISDVAFFPLICVDREESRLLLGTLSARVVVYTLHKTYISVAFFSLSASLHCQLYMAF